MHVAVARAQAAAYAERQRAIGFGVCFAVLALYPFAYLWSKPLVGDDARTFFIIPLLAGAWYFGMRGGLLVSALGLPLNILLDANVNIFSIVASCVIGIVFGWLRELHLTTRAQAAELEGERLALKAQIDLRQERETAFLTRTRQQALIADVGQLAVRADATPEAVVRAATAAAMEGLRGDYAALLEGVPGKDKLAIRGIAGAPESALGMLIPGGRGSHSGFTLLARAPTIVEDYASDSRFHTPMYAKQNGLASAVSVLVGDPKGDPYGVLAVHTRTTHRKFDHTDVHFLQALANIIAGRVERAKETPDASQARVVP